MATLRENSGDISLQRMGPDTNNPFMLGRRGSKPHTLSTRRTFDTVVIDITDSPTQAQDKTSIDQKPPENSRVKRIKQTWKFIEAYLTVTNVVVAVVMLAIAIKSGQHMYYGDLRNFRADCMERLAVGLPISQECERELSKSMLPPATAMTLSEDEYAPQAQIEALYEVYINKYSKRTIWMRYLPRKLHWNLDCDTETFFLMLFTPLSWICMWLNLGYLLCLALPGSYSRIAALFTLFSGITHFGVQESVWRSHYKLYRAPIETYLKHGLESGKIQWLPFVAYYLVAAVALHAFHAYLFGREYWTLEPRLPNVVQVGLRKALLPLSLTQLVLWLVLSDSIWCAVVLLADTGVLWVLLKRRMSPIIRLPALISHSFVMFVMVPYALYLAQYNFVYVDEERKRDTPMVRCLATT